MLFLIISQLSTQNFFGNLLYNHALLSLCPEILFFSWKYRMVAPVVGHPLVVVIFVEIYLKIRFFYINKSRIIHYELFILQFLC